MCAPNSAPNPPSRRRNRLKRGFKAVQLSLSSEVKDLETEIQTPRKDLDTRVLVSLRSRYDLASAQQGAAFATLRYDMQNFIHQQTQLQNQQHQQTRQIVLDGTTKISNQIQSMDISARDQKARDRLLNNLFFPDMNARKNQISAAHPDTFEWLFKQDMNDGDSDTSSDEIEVSDLHKGDASRISDLRSSFHDWLRNGQQVYWMSGKPGSGKSTLMNFIAEHKLTREYLQEWNKSQNLVLIESYLWNAGAEGQRTYRGVLATLLTQLLTRSPSIVDLFLHHNSDLDQKKTLMDWSVRELEKSLFHCLNTNDTCFCIFIDGLDEAEVDPTASINLILHFIETAAALTNVKCCVSSRPLPHLAFAFKDCPCLRLQDLNEADIRKYFNDNLEPIFNNVGVDLGGELQSLRHEFCDRAEGIFLWACLAVESLKRGVENFDDIHEMRKRLEILPLELEGLYRHMWIHQNKDMRVYQEEASLLLRICLKAIDRDGSHALSSLHLLFVRPSNYGLSCEALAGEISENLEQECKKIRAQILSRSAGLLKFRNNLHLGFGIERDLDISSSFPALYAALNDRVTFIHRTARDFLLNSAFGQSICSNSEHTALELDKLVYRARLCEDMITSQVPDPRCLENAIVRIQRGPTQSEQDTAVLVGDIVKAFKDRVLPAQQHLDVSNWFTFYTTPSMYIVRTRSPFAYDLLGATLLSATPWLLKDKLHHRIRPCNPAYRIYLMYCWLLGVCRAGTIFASTWDILWNSVNCSEELMRHVMHMQIYDDSVRTVGIVCSIRLRAADVLLHTIRAIAKRVLEGKTVPQLPFFENLLSLPFTYDQDVFLVGGLDFDGRRLHSDSIWMLPGFAHKMPHELSSDHFRHYSYTSILLQFKVGFLLRVAIRFVEVHFGLDLHYLSRKLSALYTGSAVTFPLIGAQERQDPLAVKLDRAESDSLATLLGYVGPSGPGKFLNDLTYEEVPATSDSVQKVRDIMEHGEKVDYLTCLKGLGLVKDVIDPNVEEGPPPLYSDEVDHEPLEDEDDVIFATAKDNHDISKPKADDSRSILSPGDSSDEDQFVDAPEGFS